MVDERDRKVWSNGARDELIERLGDGRERWRIWRDFDGDSVMESMVITRRTLSAHTL